MVNRKYVTRGCALFLVATAGVVQPACAQDQTQIVTAAQAAPADVGPAAESQTQPAEQEAQTVPATARCELHVWPTENYLGFNSGLLSGFGMVGTLVDMAAHKDHVVTVKDLMADYLGPKVQLAELEKVGILKTLELEPTEYRIIFEQPTPSNEALKGNPELKAATKALNAKIKGGQRLTDSTNPCYGELLVTYVMYHKAMMYGSNLFVGTLYRDFSGPGGTVVQSAGAVKNPLELFPPKTPEAVEPAMAELRDAFYKDFVEWSQKKLKK